MKNLGVLVRAAAPEILATEGNRVECNEFVSLEMMGKTITTCKECYFEHFYPYKAEIELFPIVTGFVHLHAITRETCMMCEVMSEGSLSCLHGGTLEAYNFDYVKKGGLWSPYDIGGWNGKMEVGRPFPGDYHATLIDPDDMWEDNFLGNDGDEGYEEESDDNDYEEDEHLEDEDFNRCE